MPTIFHSSVYSQVCTLLVTIQSNIEHSTWIWIFSVDMNHDDNKNTMTLYSWFNFQTRCIILIKMEMWFKTGTNLGFKNLETSSDRHETAIRGSEYFTRSSAVRQTQLTALRDTAHIKVGVFSDPPLIWDQPSVVRHDSFCWTELIFTLINVKFSYSKLKFQRKFCKKSSLHSPRGAVVA